MKQKWTIEQANEWYNIQGWLRGCNFIGSDCSSRIDMYQSYRIDEKLATAERELKLAQELGFNTVRLIADFDVYYAEPDSYMEVFDKYVDLCAKYGQKIMVVLAHEAQLPRGDVFVPKKMGEQFYTLGCHQGRAPLTEDQKALKPRHYMEIPLVRDCFLEMVTRTVSKYAKDERIICWNVYNEPGITIGERSIDILNTLFNLIRALDPIQPLCADVWRGVKGDKIQTKEELVAYELSDVISFHSYQSFTKLVKEINFHKKTGRPLLLTEWLHRINHNNIFDLYPLFFLNNVANYCWGFVSGKTQTYEPWECMWDDWDRGEGGNYDFTKWQHDLFRPNLRPYDPHEIELIKEFNDLAKKEGR